jgi:pyridoxal phosphate enzyme (YggS family)
MSFLARNFQHIQTKIQSASAHLSRTPSLIAVCKNQSIDSIQELINLGQKDFGENKVQEAIEHWQNYDGPPVTLHMIGALQTNKVKQAVSLFDVIQTIDRPSLAQKIAQEIIQQNKKISGFIQVNIGQEPQKSGIMPADLRAFYQYCTVDLQLPIMGLMAIPPVDENPVPYFKKMQDHANDLGVSHLSMGMSSDFESAIEQGATYVRIGTDLFKAS